MKRALRLYAGLRSSAQQYLTVAPRACCLRREARAAAMSRRGLLRILSLAGTGGGPVKYAPVLQLQEELAAARKAQEIPDILVLLEHQPVFTIGKRGREEDFRVDAERLRSRCAMPLSFATSTLSSYA